MAAPAKRSDLGLSQVVFDHQPTPIIVLSAALKVSLVNKACDLILDDAYSYLDSYISSLPIEWLNETEYAIHDALRDLLPDEKGASIDSEGMEPNRHRQSTTIATGSSLQVEWRRSDPIATAVTATLLITSFNLKEESFRMLTFENVQECGIRELSRSTSINHPTAYTDRPRPTTTTESYSGTMDSSHSSQKMLEAQFSQLCDAIYYNDERNGFLLSGDLTFCYPKYRGVQNVTPVEIDDLELFFAAWDIWDQHFQRKLLLSEYPSIWLHDHRTKFHGQRYGLKEDNKHFVLDCSGDPLFDKETGEYLGGVVWITRLGEYHDVVEADFHASLSDFEMICDRLPHLLWTVTKDGQADYFSRSWYEFTGLTEEESLGTGFSKAIDEKGMQLIWDDFAAALVTKAEINREAKYRRGDGSWRWMNVRAKPLLDSNGNILKWYGSSTDVDSLVKDRLVAEKKKMQVMDMLSMDEIGLFEATAHDNDNGQLNLLQGRLDWLDDHSMTQLLSQPPSCQTDDGMSTLWSHLRKTMAEIEGTVVFEVKLGSHWYKFRLVSDGELEEDKKVLGCCMDITEQKARADLERENARLVTQATVELEKSRLKTAFLAHISHEVRTPIVGIIGIVELVSGSNLTPEQREHVGDIEQSARNLLSIVNDILDFSKIEAGRLEFECLPFDIVANMAQVMKLFSPTAHVKDLKLISNFDSSTVLEMNGDPGRVRQILNNLVSNAIKFTTQGSIEMSLNVENTDVEVVVQDTGCGIDARTMTTLFEPFVQADTSTARVYGGTGLGLSISRNLAEGMGGTLSLKSTASCGTTAVLSLPRLRAASKPSTDISSIETTPLEAVRQVVVPPTKEAAQDKMPQSSKSSQQLILIVEDNPINQKVAVNLVRKLGYAPAAVWNGQEALDFLEQGIKTRESNQDHSSTHKAASDQTALSLIPALVLMDCQMPLLDGYEATKALRTWARFASIRSLPIIALTASAIPGDKEKCMAAGMDDYLMKPLSKSVLQSVVDKYIPRSHF